VELLRGFTPLISLRAPSRLACRTRTVWQYQHVPSLSGLLPALPSISRIRLPSAPIESLRRLDGGVLSPPHGHKAPRGARFPCFARMRPGWGGCPLDSGDDGVHATVAWSSVAACRLSTARSLRPRYHCPSQGLTMTKHQRGFTVVHPSSLPLACGPRTERGPLGFPLGFTPD